MQKISLLCATPPAIDTLSMPQNVGKTSLHATALDPIEDAAGFGRWWFDAATSRLLLSINAAKILNVDSGLHHSLESGFVHVVPGDMLPLLSALGATAVDDPAICFEFRVINEMDGLRWVRLQSVPGTKLLGGILSDVSAFKHIAMRERFSFEVTQYLVGTHELGTAVTKVIQLVCENLGWEWGAYWALDTDHAEDNLLACKYCWHDPAYQLDAFTQQSNAIRMAPGEGMVGQVWSSGKAAWVERMQNDAAFLRRKGAQDCGLQSGYAFPVAYVTPDGHRHSPGVLEFFSSLSRQHEAQLPDVSSIIGALIAQTVRRMEQQEYIRRLAQTDDLTGLANRNYFHQLLEAACFNANKTGEIFGLLYIDLDRFKPVNDAFGHDAGNAVLREFAQRLQNLSSTDCRIARLGGDEFVIMMPLPDRHALAKLNALGEAVLLAACQPFMYEENKMNVSASIGISIFSENGWAGHELLRSADAAMYRSKKSGRNALSFSSSDETQSLAAEQFSLARQLTIEAELHRALAGDEFFLEYQPVFDHFRKKILAVEALIRWRKPSGEIVRPDVFIPVAENSRLIVQIGRWVVARACHDLSLLHQAGFTDLKVNVNMAAVEFTNVSLPDELMALIETCGISTRHLCLELTEGTVMKHPGKVIPVMHMLRQLGFEISLDDFGIGHSSLSRLKNLPITSLKIDRSFISGLPHDRGDAAIVRTILDLGRHMKMQVVAEGVETDAQLVFLEQFGCMLVQGYVLSRPRTIANLIARYQPDFVQPAHKISGVA